MTKTKMRFIVIASIIFICMNLYPPTGDLGFVSLIGWAIFVSLFVGLIKDKKTEA